MRIVSYQAFLKLPAGVIFSEYVHITEMARGLWIKGETVDFKIGESFDFWKAPLKPEVRFEQDETLFVLEDTMGRAGMFDKEKEWQYIVYEKDDLKILRNIIANAIPAPRS